VQGDLEPALATVLRLEAPPAVTVAGRTDAGVHARGQVAHVDVPAASLSVIMQRTGTGDPGDARSLHDHGEGGRPAEAKDGLDDVVRRLNGVLALDVRLKAVSVAPEGFDARFSALSRRYSYRVADGWLDPLRRRDTLAHKRPLDVAAMNAAAAGLLGAHDFAAFCRRREGATTLRTLRVLEFVRDEVGVAVARVEADAFCHTMVRSLVGVLLEVGDGRRDPAWAVSVLAGRDRSAASTVAAPHGLTLEEVRYPDDAELLARATQTRRRRDEAD
jgi:tRNA pseudouridine38-40 synthase